jgi:Glycosyl hydrolases family 6
MAGPPPPPVSRWFVDPAEPAARYPDLAPLSSQPRFNWQGRWTHWHGFDRWLATVPPGRVPLIATMRSKPNGALATKTSAAMVPWYRRFVRHLGDRRAIIAFEPDSLGWIDTIRPSAARWRRMWALRRSLWLLSRLPNATVYVEAGASDWELSAARRGSCGGSASGAPAASLRTSPTTHGPGMSTATAWP